MQTITFEDEFVHQLFPITLARPAYAMLCGSFRLVDWIELLDDTPQAVVRDYLVEIQEADYPCFRQRDVEAPRTHTMWINARLVPSRHTFETLRTLRDRGEIGIVHSGSAVAVAILPETAPPPPAELRAATLHEYFEQLGLAELQPLDAELHLIDYPHQLIQFNQDTLTDNLVYRLQVGRVRGVGGRSVCRGRAHDWARTWWRTRDPDPLCWRAMPASVRSRFSPARPTWGATRASSSTRRSKTTCPSATPRKSAAKLRRPSSNPTRTNSITDSWDTATSAAGSIWEPARATAI